MLKKLIGASVVCAVALPVIAGGLTSGLNVGEMVTPFHPTHLSGPDKGTDTCPPCKYGARPAVQVWNNGDAEANIGEIAKVLSAEVKDSKSELKGFIINLTMCAGCEAKAEHMAKKTTFDNIAIAKLATTNEAVKNYKVNTAAEVKNTVFVYRNKKVVAKFVNLKADKEGIADLQAAIAKAEN